MKAQITPFADLILTKLLDGWVLNEKTWTKSARVKVYSVHRVHTTNYWCIQGHSHEFQKEGANHHKKESENLCTGSHAP